MTLRDDPVTLLRTSMDESGMEDAGDAGWTDEYARCAEMLRSGMIGEAFRGWTGMLDLGGMVPASVAAGIGGELPLLLIELADDGFTGDPDLSPLGDFLLELRGRGYRDPVTYLFAAAFNRMMRAVEGTRERSYASRMAYLMELLCMQMFRLGHPPSFVQSISMIMSNIGQDIESMKGGRPIPRLKGTSAFLGDLAAAIGKHRLTAERTLDISQGWMERGFGDVWSRMESARIGYADETLPRTGGRRELESIVRDILAVDSPSIMGRTCARCRKWTPGQDDGGWVCSACGCSVYLGSAAAHLADIGRAVAAHNLDRLGTIVEMLEEDGPSGMADHGDACCQALNLNFGEAFRTWADLASMEDEELNDAIRRDIPACLRSAADNPGGKAHYDSLCMADVFHILSDDGFSMEREMISIMESRPRTATSWNGMVCAVAMAAAIRSEDRAAVQDLVLDACMACDGLSVRKILNEASSELLDHLYSALDGMSDEAFAGRGGAPILLDRAASAIENVDMKGLAKLKGYVDQYLGLESQNNPARKPMKTKPIKLEADLKRVDKGYPDMTVDELIAMARLTATDVDPEDLMAIGEQLVSKAPEDWRSWFWKGTYRTRYWYQYSEACPDWTEAVGLVGEEDAGELADMIQTEVLKSVFIPDDRMAVPDGAAESDAADLVRLGEALTGRFPSLGSPYRFVLDTMDDLIGMVPACTPDQVGDLSYLLFEMAKGMACSNPDPDAVLAAAGRYRRFHAEASEVGDGFDGGKSIHTAMLHFFDMLESTLSEALEYAGPDASARVRGAWEGRDCRDLMALLDSAGGCAYEMTGIFRDYKEWDSEKAVMDASIITYTKRLLKPIL